MKESSTAELLRKAKVIIWDEVSMAKRQAIEAVNRMLQDIMNCNLPFGGKVIVLGGDFRQVLPIAPKKTRAEQIDTTIVRSSIWHTLEKIKLKENMKAKPDLLSPIIYCVLEMELNRLSLMISLSFHHI